MVPLTRAQRNAKQRAEYVANKAYYAAKNAQWVRDNPLANRERSMRRYARLRAVTVEPVDFAAILGRDGWWCYLCECDVESTDLSFDHMIPLVRGGAHSEANIRVTHSRCNSSKRELTPEEFWARKAA